MKTLKIIFIVAVSLCLPDGARGDDAHGAKYFAFAYSGLNKPNGDPMVHIIDLPQFEAGKKPAKADFFTCLGAAHTKLSAPLVSYLAAGGELNEFPNSTGFIRPDFLALDSSLKSGLLKRKGSLRLNAESSAANLYYDEITGSFKMRSSNHCTSFTLDIVDDEQARKSKRNFDLLALAQWHAQFLSGEDEDMSKFSEKQLLKSLKQDTGVFKISKIDHFRYLGVILIEVENAFDVSLLYTY